MFIGITYGVFFVFLLLQHQLVFLQHDDFGYAVLSYVTERTGFQGQEWTLADLVAFVMAEYKVWTGRLASHFLHIYAQKIGLDFVRFVNSLAMASVAFLSFLLARDPDASPAPKYLQALVPVLLFLAMPRHMLVDGFYWFTASAVHFWGTPFFLAAAWLARSATRLPALSVLLFSFSASFSEPIGLAAMGYVTMFAVLGHGRNARAIVRAAIRSSPIFVVAAVTLFSPGNSSRFTAVGGPELYTDLGVAGVVIRNIEWIAGQLFRTNLFVLLLFMILGSIIMLLSLWFAAPRHERTALPRALAGRAHAAIALLLMSPTGRSVVCIYVASLASLLPILAAPHFSAGYFMFFLTLLFVPVSYAIAVPASMWVRHTAIVVILILGGVSVKNAAVVFDGYRANGVIHEINDAQLRVTSFMQGMGMGPDGAVTLFKLKDRRFATTTPYERPLIEAWMKKYYRLAPDTEFTWK